MGVGDETKDRMRTRNRTRNKNRGMLCGEWWYRFRGFGLRRRIACRMVGGTTCGSCALYFRREGMP